ncbi:LysR family transcriptional regulator [Aquincola tertiaricarbonis]|uniref:LysR family transcriptional regulator n=1 Tax=Aquincola tertiaricarbonis TaxID=391953 RepID=A0ABY4SCV2_AQUTE|nr:LysR family transcriptional regulator [Aquincola tertiaricarbonis]URI09932.1 LysR family transcriptional regulator [Aquincola tertiaricarbonis]
MALHFDLTDLRLMLRVAESGSLTRAAEAVHLSLPAASTRIKHLEEGAGAKLLLRTPQGVSLTPPGQALVHHARVVLAQIEHLRDDLQEYAQGIKGHLRVYANSTALCEYLPPVLHRYLQRHPDVSVDLRERLSHDVVRAVQEGQTDIGIVAGNVPTDGLQVRPYRSDRLVLVVPAGHALAQAAEVDFVDTLAWPQVGLTEASALHTFLRRICEGLQRTLRMRIEVGNFEAACRMIEAGIGVGVLPESAAGRHAATMAIHRVPLRDAWALREMQVCVRNLEALPPFARDLVDLLDQDARAQPT